MSENQRLLALLIDGDNAQPALIPQILNEVKQHGRPIIKNVYGDPSQDQILKWKPTLTKFGIEPKYSHHISSHKNATDIALVIDAMDILHDGKVEVFCIVSSDKDFAHLATRIKRSGLEVIGVGNQNSLGLNDVYDRFVSIESLNPPAALPPPEPRVPLTFEEMPDADFAKLFLEAYRTLIAERVLLQSDGWIPLKDLIFTLKTAVKPNPRIAVTKLTAFAAVKPDALEIQEQNEGKQVTHAVRVPEYLKHTGVFTLYRVYQQETAKLQPKDDGWVLLSSIGSAFQAAHPNYDYRMYKGERSASLTKVIERMNADYPSSVLLSTDSQRLKIRMPKSAIPK
jgi:uncharacterized LabA/DUF88 family protein